MEKELEQEYSSRPAKTSLKWSEFSRQMPRLSPIEFALFLATILKAGIVPDGMIRSLKRSGSRDNLIDR
jgi:hypothetical protein